jgi:hypothetical protein
MPWVRRHRRSAPYSWFRGALIPILVVIAVILLLIALF